ncbi:ADP-forming succinate--CoA ligase subunit beta [Candidatus Bathyarchaeota archaeon]|nr:MAG: ADP-forming succinate--CoA ligase subunit beta [Candidatus Bathyarchaeota archaeon]
MNLLEFEAKEVFSRYGIPVPRGEVASTPSQAEEVAERLGVPVAVKAQVAAGGRGKAGGILFAETPQEARDVAGRLLGSEIHGLRVRKVLVEERLRIKRELYFGITVDRSSRCYVAIASSEGGVEIEEVAATAPERIVRFPIDPLYGLKSYHALRIAKALGYSGRQLRSLSSLFHRLYTLAVEQDAELTEINPLVETPEGEFIAADARLNIDDNALFRHPEFKERLFSEERGDLTPEELEARRRGLAYVKLDGEIGVIGNGAGLTMATLDMIRLQGGRAADFLDLGGGASSERMSSALSLLFSDPRVRVVLINILGGITRCDEVARGILEVKEKMGFRRPIVVRMIGTNEEEGRRILREAGVEVLESMEEAAERAVEIARRE